MDIADSRCLLDFNIHTSQIIPSIKLKSKKLKVFFTAKKKKEKQKKKTERKLEAIKSGSALNKQKTCTVASIQLMLLNHNITTQAPKNNENKTTSKIIFHQNSS